MNLKCTINVKDEVNCLINGLKPEHNKILFEKFGIFVDGYKYMPAFQLRRWDGKIHFFDELCNTFVKILDEILPFICSWGYDVNIIDLRISAPVIKERIDNNFFNLDNFKFRDYQVDIVNALIEEGSGITIAATGSGKTSITAALAAVLYKHGLQTIIIVPSSDLVTQTIADFRTKLVNFPYNIGEYSGSHKDIDNPIVIATWQSLQNAPHYMSFFKAVIVDECHGTKAAIIKDLINNHGSHISHRYGCTGTFPKSIVDQYSLKLSLGRIVKEVPASWLIDQGYLSTILIEPIEMQDEDSEYLPDYASERAYLTRHDERSEAIAELIQELRQKYGNTMVLVNTQSLAQGRYISSLIPDSIYLDGGAKNIIRQEEYAKYADKNDICVIASAGIAATGLSIDRIFCLILLDTGKSFVRCIQAVGRGLRKNGDKSEVYVADIYSKMKYGRKHWNDRKKYYIEAHYPTIKPRKLKY